MGQTEPAVKNKSLLTSRIRCAECGSFFRRKMRSGTVKWVCSRHEDNTHDCESFYYSEERIYDGFITVLNNLRFGQEDILGRVISKLEYTALQYKRRNAGAARVNQSMAEINATILKLNELRTKGYLAPEVHESQVRDLKRKLNLLREERQSEYDSDILKMLAQVRKFKDLLGELEEPLEAFDEKLFRELVEGVTINNHDEMAVTFIGGLTFTEQI